MTDHEPDSAGAGTSRHEVASEVRFVRKDENDADRFDNAEDSAQSRFDQNENSAQSRFDLNETNEVARDRDRLVLNEAAAAKAEDYYQGLVTINRKLRHVVAVFCVLVVVVAGGLWMKIDGQSRNADKGRAAIQANTEQNRLSGERIRDCVDPAGRCFKDGQARTAAAIKSLNDYNRLGRACAATVPIKAGTTTEQALLLIDACIAARTPRPAAPAP